LGRAGWEDGKSGKAIAVQYSAAMAARVAYNLMDAISFFFQVCLFAVGDIRIATTILVCDASREYLEVI